MTPERMAELVARWVRFYTRDLPPPIARRRIDEIDADLHDHIAHERAHGTGDRRIALSIAARMVRACRRRLMARPDDPRSSTRKEVMKRVAVVTTVILLLPLVAMQFTDEVNWGVFDFVFAGALLGGTGLLLELAVEEAAQHRLPSRRRRGRRRRHRARGGDDAPGLVLFGCLLIAGTVALAVRTARAPSSDHEAASQPGARPHSGSGMRSAGRPAVASSQAITEFEFHSPRRGARRPPDRPRDGGDEVEQPAGDARRR